MAEPQQAEASRRTEAMLTLRQQLVEMAKRQAQLNVIVGHLCASGLVSPVRWALEVEKASTLYDGMTLAEVLKEVLRG